MSKPISLSVSNNNDGTWSVWISATTPEGEYFKASLVTTSDYDLCRRLFNLNWPATAPEETA